MKSYKIKKSKLSGKLVIPPSKSHTLRSILFASLAKGKSVIENYLLSPDSHAMINACRLFGATIDISQNQINIEGIDGKINFAEDVINAGNSGIVLRFCSAIGALCTNSIVLTGDHSIRHYRPMMPLLEGLSQLKVKAHSMRNDGFAPVIIQGPIQPGKTVLNGEDSQPVSGLLMASAFASGPIEISVRNPGERPWVALTLDWFDRLGVSYINNNYEHYIVNGNSNYQGFKYTVPGDLSSAAFPIAAAIVTSSEMVLYNIDMNDVQGDKELINVFKKMGANIEIDPCNRILYVKKGNNLVGTKVDINNFIDGITILAIVACFAEGETHIYNGEIARHKECNRIDCIVHELKKMGADIEATQDGLIIRKSELKGASLNSYNDHRMAMSLVVAAMGANGESTISGVDCISKTHPSFLKDFKAIGSNIMELS